MKFISTRRAVALVAAGVFALGACGADDAGDSGGDGGGEVEVSDSMQSGVDDEFKLVDQDSKTYVVGHGIVLEMADGWQDYEAEFLGSDGSTIEWAVGQPVETSPFPAGLQFSMGLPGRGAQVTSGMDIAVEKLAEIAPGYEFIEKGDVEVPGAEAAKFLRFKRDQDYNGTVTTAEQVTLIVQVEDDISSTIRFVAPEGQWDEMMSQVYDSVRVATD